MSGPSFNPYYNSRFALVELKQNKDRIAQSFEALEQQVQLAVDSEQQLALDEQQTTEELVQALHEAQKRGATQKQMPLFVTQYFETKVQGAQVRLQELVRADRAGGVRLRPTP